MELKKNDKLQTPEWVYRPLGLFDILFPFGPEAIDRIKDSGLPGTFNKTLWFKPRSA